MQDTGTGNPVVFVAHRTDCFYAEFNWFDRHHCLRAEQPLKVFLLEALLVTAPRTAKLWLQLYRRFGKRRDFARWTRAGIPHRHAGRNQRGTSDRPSHPLSCPTDARHSSSVLTTGSKLGVFPHHTIPQARTELEQQSLFCCFFPGVAELLQKSDLRRHPVPLPPLCFRRKELDFFLKIKALSRVPQILVRIPAAFAVSVAKSAGVPVVFQTPARLADVSSEAPARGISERAWTGSAPGTALTCTSR